MRRDRIGVFFLAESWADSVARLPAAFHADRDARWMLNSLQVTLTPRGAELAGRCVLELLRRFEGRQIATLGLTAVPIVSSVIMQSGGRYHGLLVRQQRKKHGSLKLIEGPIDPDEPTIVIDEKRPTSPASMWSACWGRT